MSELVRPVGGDPPADTEQHAVHLERSEHGWEVRILDASGTVLGTRACVGETEARTFASTVSQHIYWLSPETFREYYRLPESG